MPYIERERREIAKEMQNREQERPKREISWDQRRNSGVFSHAASNIFI